MKCNFTLKKLFNDYEDFLGLQLKHLTCKVALDKQVSYHVAEGVYEYRLVCIAKEAS